MELGWCDVCLRASHVGASREFYEALGFRRVEGNDDDGWAVMTNGDVRLGLYEARHMGDAPFSLNFRGGDVRANAEVLASRGLILERGPIEGPKGGWSAWLRDPDGHEIFLDTAPGETKKG
jgi:catechol 2,3-dioxygenase-like lactoylglutathione lyase family enzyme